MSAAMCAVCNAGFFGRSDALYCSSACRQKAHRARTARRVAALRERAVRAPAAARAGAASAPIPAQTQAEVSRTLRRAAASSMRRSREQIDRAHVLCQMSRQRLQEHASPQHETSIVRGAPWPGN
jgi:hypothetical protein